VCRLEKRSGGALSGEVRGLSGMIWKRVWWDGSGDSHSIGFDKRREVQSDC